MLIYAIAIPLGIYSGHPPLLLWGPDHHVRGLYAVLAPVVLDRYAGDRLSLRWRFFLCLSWSDVSKLLASWSLWQRFLDRFWHLCLPVSMLSYAGFASLSRLCAAACWRTFAKTFARQQCAKGLAELVVIYKHVLRNSLIPIVTIMASILPGLISGSVIIETIFSIPGLGQLGYAVLARDYPIIMAVFTISSLLTLVSILLSDLLLTIVDPRITFSGRSA